MVCLIGVVLAVFVPTFVGEIRTSKVSEASEELASLHGASAAYFAASHGGGRRQCLPDAAGPAPAEPSTDPVDVNFQADDVPGSAIWKALDWQPARPIRYRYTFVPAASGCGLSAAEDGPLLTLRAEGDLDGDGKRSLFEREATVDSAGDLVPIGVLYMLDRVE